MHSESCTKDAKHTKGGAPWPALECGGSTPLSTDRLDDPPSELKAKPRDSPKKKKTGSLSSPRHLRLIFARSTGEPAKTREHDRSFFPSALSSSYSIHPLGCN